MGRRAAIVVGILLALCCVASAMGGLLYLYWPRAVSKPVVLISSPLDGEDVQVGEAVAIHAVARDSAGIARVELWVDGEFREAQDSSLPHGTSPFPLVASWQPVSPGSHTLTVRAFNTQDSRAYSSVTVEACQVADRDGDGIPDENDMCPEEPGFGPSLGCPDGDGDGIADADDACPDQVGVPGGRRVPFCLGGGPRWGRRGGCGRCLP